MPDIYKSEIIRGWGQNLSISYKNPAYVAANIFPKLLLDSPKQKIWKANKGDIFRSEAQIRAAGAESATRTRKGTSVNLDTDEYGIKEFISNKDLAARGIAAGMVPPADLMQEAIESCSDQLDLRQEIAVAAFIVAGTWADGNAGGEDAGGLWKPAGSTNTFVTDVSTGIATLRGQGIDVASLGLLIDGKTWESLRHADDIRDRIKYTSAQSVTPAMVANLFSLKEVVIGGALKNTDDEKADGSDGTYVQIWEKNANKGLGFLYYKPPKLGQRMVAPGIQGSFKMENGAGRISERYYDNKRKGWWVESREDIGVDDIDYKAGYLWNDTYAS